MDENKYMYIVYQNYKLIIIKDINHSTTYAIQRPIVINYISTHGEVRKWIQIGSFTYKYIDLKQFRLSPFNHILFNTQS